MAIETRQAARPATLERRVISLPDDLRVEARAEGDAKQGRIVGHAAVFDRWATLYDGEYFTWREIVRPGAFRNAIVDRQDVRCLFNHDSNYVLGRTSAGTLTLSEDATGLLSDAEAPDTQTIRDLVLAPMARGDINQMSFAFKVRKGDQVATTQADGVTVTDYGGERETVRRDGEKTIVERELLDLDLFDTSPVTYPAYEETDCALRTRGAQMEAEIRRRVLAANDSRKSDRLALMRMSLRLAGARGRGGIR